MSEVSARRQINWVDNSVQGALLRRLFLHWGLFVINVCLMGAFVQFVGNPTAAISDNFQQIFRNQLPFLFIMLLMIPMFVFNTISLSNRFVGPIYKLRNALNRLKRGEAIEPLHFRKGDFWQGLAEDFNAVMVQKAAVGSGVVAPPVAVESGAEVSQAS